MSSADDARLVADLAAARTKRELAVDLPHCGEWLYDEDAFPYQRCGDSADLILWGRMFPPEALGPRCIDHASRYMPTDGHAVSQWAVFDLRPVRAIVGRNDV